MAQPARSTDRIVALDGVRGLAILLVLAHQLLLDTPLSRPLRMALTPMQAGWIGVELFFVLSGFLITGILLDSKGANNFWSAFFMRRTLRIFPPYYFLLGLTFIVIPTLWPTPPDVSAEHQHQIWYWAYLTNWRFLGNAPGVTSLGNCWSLAIEEQFYLFWPLAVAFLTERGLVRLCLVTIVGAFVFRVVLAGCHVDPEIIYESTFTRADGLALGALVAVLVRRPESLAQLMRRGAKVGGWLAVAALLATAAASGGFARRNPISQTVGQTLVALASGLLIAGAVWQSVNGPKRLTTWLSQPLLIVFGRYSYAIYLFHLPLHLLVSRRFLIPAVHGTTSFIVVQGAYFLVAPAALLALAMAFHRVVERPLLGLKRYFVANQPLPDA